MKTKLRSYVRFSTLPNSSKNKMKKDIYSTEEVVGVTMAALLWLGVVVVLGLFASVVSGC